MEEVLAAVEADPASLGLVLHGSRATDAGRTGSDYDLVRVVVDEAYDRYPQHEKSGDADVVVQTPSRLRRLADERGWWTAAFVTARVVLDKTGEIEPLLRAIVDAADEAAFHGVAESYDGYLNSWVRSMKAWRRGDELGGRLHAAESAVHLLRTLFGLERRWLPYFDALEPGLSEVERAQGWGDGYVRSAVLQLLDSGEPGLQQVVEAQVEALMDARGFPHEWGRDLEPLKALRFD